MSAAADTEHDARTKVDGHSPRDSSQPSTPASCTLCRRRKVKCDRTVPCGNCQRSKVDCVPFIPSRVARGRQGGRKRKRDEGELLERISKLEGLVRSIEGDGIPQGEQERTDSEGINGVKNANGYDGPPGIHEQTQSTAPRLEKYLATSFWVGLSEELHGLKDVLGASSDDEDQDEGELAPPSNISSLGQQQSNHSGFAILRTTMGEDIIPPKPHQVYTFCDVYMANVDPIFKVLHGPSLRKYLQENGSELDSSPGCRGLKALRFAIYYAAVTSMEDGECRHRIGEDRKVLLERYRAGIESALATADFVNTVELSTLQALAIYLVSVRANDSSRLTWTLTSLIIRIAEAMGLHQDITTSSFRPLENEMRRRLWWQICNLDSYAAEDRASNSVVAANSFTTKLPLNINDEDISLESSNEPKERQGLTDMTFCLSCLEVLDVRRKLLYVPASAVGPSQAAPLGVHIVDIIVNQQRHIEEKYLRHLNLTNPYHWFIRMVADIITAVMWLFVYRPMKRRPDNVPSSQATHPNILRLSVDVLERMYILQTEPAGSHFRWLSQTYVQWHALAVTIAELCVKTDGPMVERAWAIVEPVFEQMAHHVADSDRGMLWRPMKKLMSKARGVRQKYLTSRSAMAAPSSPVAVLNTTVQKDPLIGTGQSHSESNGQTQWSLQGIMDLIPDVQPVDAIAISEPFDWDPWLNAATAATTTTTQSQYNPNTDHMAWTNWEGFIDDFQGQSDALEDLTSFTPEYSTERDRMFDF